MIWGVCQVMFVPFVGVITPIGCGQGTRELGRNKAVVKAPLGLDTTSSGSNGDAGTARHA